MQIDMAYDQWRPSWMFRVEHMGQVITGWSLDKQGAERAAEKSRQFLLELATDGLVVDVDDVEQSPGETL